ncbi:hypothetical protein K461DRAFT_292279 [Myriangium duriaei CBS 260.36]|uniref:Hydrophobin n=1 Tax=Myriangium duriaei CBS 260.36 TaxID=1168546 RepID=A0A9P4MMP5_9PEZI|nr:hypothetical protein K461DRAFT_292279 [Myriangium duriaei CBS 260.36]
MSSSLLIISNIISSLKDNPKLSSPSNPIYLQPANMRASIIAGLALWATSAFAVPTNGGGGGGGSQPICTGTYKSQQCCATDVVGAAGLNCFDPRYPPKNKADFIKECAEVGQQARCCAIPILGQGVLCESPLT